MNVYKNLIKYWKVYLIFSLFLLNILEPSCCFAGSESKPEDILNNNVIPSSKETGFLDTVLLQILNLCLVETEGIIQGYAFSLYERLIILDFVLAVIFGLIAFDGSPNFLTVYMTKIMKYGFWAYVIKEWRTLIVAINDSLLQVGIISGATRDIALQPSQVIDKGYKFAWGFWDFCLSTSIGFAWQIPVMNPLAIVIGAIGGIIVILGFVHLAISVFVTSAEFYICSTLALIFIPFAVFDKTEQFSSKAIMITVSSGIKMMVYTFLLGFFDKFLQSNGEVQGLFAFKDAGIFASFVGIVVIFIMLYLVTNAATLASTITTGNLGFNSSSAMSSIKSAAETAATVAAIPAGAAAGAAKAYAATGSKLQAAKEFGKGVAKGTAKALLSGKEGTKSVYNAARGQKKEND